jgi:hypothetical protein
VIVACPSCGSNLSPHKLKTRLRGGSECPVCNAALRWSPPYHLIVLWGSFPILVFFVVSEGIRGGIRLVIMMVLTWLLQSIAISVILAWIKPPKLKLAEDGNAPPTLFTK